jgi:hypothetical protein
MSDIPKGAVLADEFRVDSDSAAVLAVIDSTDPRGALFRQVLLPVLRFWGVPLRLLDLADLPAEPPDPGAVALVLLAQEGIAAERLSGAAGLIGRAARAGAGLVVCDPAIEASVDEAGGLALSVRPWSGIHAVGAATVAGDGFVTRLQRSLGRLAFDKPVPALARGGGTVALAAADGTPLLVLRDGPPRIVEWGLSTSLWAADSFGFGRGADALLWRSLLWAARRPFAMAAFPPFGRFRFDDCRGLWRGPQDLAFLAVMAELGERPNLGICLSAVTDEGWRELAARARRGEIEVVPHVQAPEVGIFNVAELPEGGTAAPDPLAAGIRDLFAAHGCPMADSVSDHNHEITARGRRIARELGMRSRMNVLRLGETWDGLHRDWRPAPFGRLNYVLDRFVDAPELFTAINHHLAFDQSLTRLPDGHFLCTTFGGFTADRWDFLNGLVDGQGRVDLDAAAGRLAVHAELALNSLFFLGSISHTHFIRHLDAAGWRRLLEAYRGAADPHGHRPRPYGEIAAYAAWRAALGAVRIAPEPAAEGPGPALWGVLARDGGAEPVLSWGPLSHSGAA